jgi:hypothetical protein
VSKFLLPLFCALLVCVAHIPLWSQATTATISGTVTDASGAVVPGITVTAVNPETNLSRTATTDEFGGYSIKFLPVGTYRVQAIGAGFKKFEQTGVVLDVSLNARGPGARIGYVAGDGVRQSGCPHGEHR